MNAPLVLRASIQKRCEAGRSPFMGSSTTSTGAFSVSARAASSKKRARAEASTNLRSAGGDSAEARVVSIDYGSQPPSLSEGRAVELAPEFTLWQ